MLPRLQASYGSSGCSPQGLVDSIRPTCGVGFSSLMRSMYAKPGSPVCQAFWTMIFQISPLVISLAARSAGTGLTIFGVVQ